MINNSLNDRVFLQQLDKQRLKESYARITLLTFNEEPIEYIEGKVTGGSINFDGASSVRRTCNISIVSANQDINLYYLGLERKFILELGVMNNIDNKYPKIIWFPMGLFVTSNFTTARNTNSYSISIQGKDKMSLLNGDLSGNLPSSVDFGTLEEVSEDGKTITYTKVKIKDIIFNLIESYGNEMPHNIIINDLEENGLELLEYRGTIPVYLYCEINTDNLSHEYRCLNFTLNDKNIIQTSDGSNISLDEANTCSSYDLISNNLNSNQKYKITINNEKKDIYIVKIKNGDCIGYRETDLVYAGDLIANVNDTITSVLDKIKNMLGEYEYFYDTKGRFVFQKKKNKYEPASFGHDENTTYYDNYKVESDIFYNFENNELITSINNTPTLTNAKNDYSIWGVRKTINGGEVPIHLRYAIEQKPIQYTTYQPKDIGSNEDDYNTWQWTYKKGDDGSYIIDFANKIITCDWREIIYQMASDYNKYKDLYNDFFAQIRDNNQIYNSENEIEYLYPTGKTGYELYYTDILGFWRDIFIPIDIYKSQYKTTDNETIVPISLVRKQYQQVLLTEKLYQRNHYYLKEPCNKNIVNRFPKYSLCTAFEYDDNNIYYKDVLTLSEKQEYNFHPDVQDNPSQLNFWFDFLDTTGELSKYSTKTIGQRSKCVNDNKITSIYYRPVPNLIFINPELGHSSEKTRTSYNYVNSSEELENCFVTASQGKNAWEEAQTYLNNFGKCTEQISFNAIPIYYMIPNVRISLKDGISKMNGEYKIDKISFNLNYNGTMSVTATKIFDDIY